MTKAAVETARMMPVAIGWWYAECCACSLCRLESDDDVWHLCGLLEEDWYATLFQGVWPTQEDAVRDLEARGLGVP